MDAEPSAALSKLDIGSGGEDFSLKAGERIKIQVPLRHSGDSAAAKPSGIVGGGSKLVLRPPGSTSTAPTLAAPVASTGARAAAAPAPAPAPASDWVTF